MKSNKKGFTLIELLAVIVILAIIALIATPIILNVIDTARKGAKESSALGYIDAVEKHVMISQVENDLIIPSGTYTVAALTELGVDVKGEKPEDESTITIDSKGAVSSVAMYFADGGYGVTYSSGKAKASKGEPTYATSGLMTVSTSGTNTYIVPVA